MLGAIWQLAQADWQCWMCNRREKEPEMGRATGAGSMRIMPIVPRRGDQSPLDTPREESQAALARGSVGTTSGSAASHASLGSARFGVVPTPTGISQFPPPKGTPLVQSILGSPLMASTPLWAYNDRSSELDSYEASVISDSLDSEYVLQITECHQRLEENLQASIQRERAANRGKSFEESQALPELEGTEPRTTGGPRMGNKRSLITRNGLRQQSVLSQQPSGVFSAGAAEQPEDGRDAETEAQKVNRVYEEEEIAKKIGNMRRELNFDAANERQMAAAAQLGSEAEQRRKAREKLHVWGPMEQEKQFSPRSPHQEAPQTFRERQARLRHELEAEQHRTEHKLDKYRTIMQDKFTDIGAKDWDLKPPLHTSDPAKAVRDAVGQYHRHMIITGKFYPLPGEKTSVGIAMSQVEELSHIEAILENSDPRRLWPAGAPPGR